MLNIGKNSEKKTYPIIPIRDGIVFPSTENVLVFGRSKSVQAMKIAMEKDKRVVLLMQKKLEQVSLIMKMIRE